MKLTTELYSTSFVSKCYHKFLEYIYNTPVKWLSLWDCIILTDTWRHNSVVLRQNDVATSFWRNIDVIITSCVRWNTLKQDGNISIATNE